MIIIRPTLICVRLHYDYTTNGARHRSPETVKWSMKSSSWTNNRCLGPYWRAPTVLCFVQLRRCHRYQYCTTHPAVANNFSSPIFCDLTLHSHVLEYWEQRTDGYIPDAKSLLAPSKVLYHNSQNWKKIVLESRSVVSRFFSLYYSVMEKIVVLSKIRVDGRNSQNR